MKHLKTAIAGKSVRIPFLEITCPICFTTSQMETIGYTLPQNQLDKESGAVRFVLQGVSGDSPLKCDHILPFLKENPIVSLWVDNNRDGSFN